MCNKLRGKQLVFQAKLPNNAFMKLPLLLISLAFPATLLAEPLFDFVNAGYPSFLKFAERLGWKFPMEIATTLYSQRMTCSSANNQYHSQSPVQDSPNTSP